MNTILPKGWIYYCTACLHERKYCYCGTRTFGKVGDGVVGMGQQITIAPPKIISDKNFYRNNSMWLDMIGNLILQLTGDFDWHYHIEKYNKLAPILQEIIEKH